MAGELLAAHLAPADAGLAAQQQAIERLHARLGHRYRAVRRRPHGSLQRRAFRYRVYQHGAKAAAGCPGAADRPGPSACRTAAGSWQASAAATPPCCGHNRVPRRDRAGGGAVRLSARAPAHARLERLQEGVESLGAGELSARVKVEGKDEVARLAESFNSAAARIEELVSAHKMLLANTSHELRTPSVAHPPWHRAHEGRHRSPSASAALEKDIAELDGLIEEILLSSRLDANKAIEAPEDVDLLALAAEEAARYEHCSVAGSTCCCHGQSCPAAADGAQPARQRRAARSAADRGRCRLSRETKPRSAWPIMVPE